MTHKILYTVHIDTRSGARFSKHDSKDDMRQSLIEYFNEAHADCASDELAVNTSLDTVIDKIEEIENVSIDEVGDDEHERARSYDASGALTYGNANSNTIVVSDAERDTILAALRLWQDFREGMPSDEQTLKGIATNGNAHPMLTTAAVDDLCERVNT